jgi:hypothetical protein
MDIKDEIMLQNRHCRSDPIVGSTIDHSVIEQVISVWGTCRSCLLIAT